ncbi:beta-ketoacyl synthase N-terminal-like domain-containing protein [Kitasatospora sp. NPDC048286]|uniref:type I polyketide synthase n=1 Tax=Kitasatospora sp. NPDC048286 TaxID=3364047 RepID=UPI00371A0A64
MDSAEIRTLMEDQLRLSQRLRARVAELEAERHAPVAVIGMGLRLPPDLNSPAAYWEFLRSGRTGLSGLPEDRPGLRAVYDPVPGTPGRSYADRAGFLSDIASFDADFFGISTREARLLDPQQRMLLETAWEALERAGLAVRRADRLPVGVYLGIMASEYSERLEDRADTTRIDPYYTTGGGLCFGAGRISFVLGFSGPVVSVDTACSSSLSALHLAVRGLRNGECRYALVCGSNLLLSANLMVSLSQSRALSPEGRSKSFLASADGYGRGEGVGSLALMRLDEAQREGRPILAVIRGTAINHDGAASGLTAPNGPAQQEVIRAALADARTAPAELGWIEAHGTGTVLGDPIEIGALDGVFGAAVRERGEPLAIGSVKSRLGHLEAASGIAAVIKTVLMLQHGELPAAAAPQDGELNPAIPWERLPFTVGRKHQPWPAALPRRVAGVNSFGMSGTNAHVVLEAYQPAPQSGAEPDAQQGWPELLILSAKDSEALARLTEQVRDHLVRAEPARTASLCHTLRTGRTAFAHRVAVIGTTPAELAARLAGAEPAKRAPVRAVTLRVTDDRQRLGTAVTALAQEFPALATDADPADPAAALHGMLRALGLDARTEHGRGPELAELSWNAGGTPVTRPLLAGDGEIRTAFLTALGGLFTAGAELRLDGLRSPGARLLGDLPTYPFLRRRYWVDEPLTAAGPAGGGAGAGLAEVPPAGDSGAVRAYLLAELADVLQSPEALDPELSFLESGGDSFTSTLFITRVEEHYEISLTPEELPLDLPLDEMFERLSTDIAETAGASAR